MHFLFDLRSALPSRLAAFLIAGLLTLGLGGCATQPGTGTPVRLDETRRHTVR